MSKCCLHEIYGQQALLKMRVDAIHWGKQNTRVQNCFVNFLSLELIDDRWQHVHRPIETLGQLIKVNEAALYREPNFGHASLNCVREVLRGYNLRLGTK